jgi:phosphatidylinositol-3-phosphatase
MSIRARLLRVAVGAMLVTGLTVPAVGVLAHDADSSTLNHVFVIMLENHSEANVIGDTTNAPFINQLAATYGQATNYYGVTHPSLPNYIAALSGSNWFVQTDDASLTFNHTNLVDQLESHGKSWAAYMEAMPANDKLVHNWPADNNALYANKHNPFVLFDDIRNNPARMAKVKPYSSFASDLAHGKVANFVWISPDQCNDMHGGVYSPVPGYPETPCPYGTTTPQNAADAQLIENADNFVKTAVTEIMHSRAWTGNSVIFVLTDENDYTFNAAAGGYANADGCCDSPILPAADPRVGAAWPGGTYGGGLIPSIVIARHGVRHYVSNKPYNHYSLLRTIEEAWHLGYLGNASDSLQVKSMREFLSHH